MREPKITWRCANVTESVLESALGRLTDTSFLIGGGGVYEICTCCMGTLHRDHSYFRDWKFFPLSLFSALRSGECLCVRQF